MRKADLRIDWADRRAARYACRNWHYAGCIPKSKQVYVGAWESGRFIGVVAFGRSSTPYLGNAYGLDQTECAELTRIALRDHLAPVSRIMAIAIRMIRRQSPGLRLLVSLADPSQGHHGGVYQATGWIYVGRSTKMKQHWFRGKWRNDTNLNRACAAQPGLRETLATRTIDGKHKYLFPLDQDIRARIEPLAQPYPKRAKRATTGSTGTAAVRHRPARSIS